MPEIVEKAWGRELVICNNEKYCGKILELDQGATSSLHYHEKKDETFYVLSGTVLVFTELAWMELSEGQSVRIHPGIHHRFCGMVNCSILEVSTPHSDEDVVRLEPSIAAPGKKA